MFRKIFQITKDCNAYNDYKGSGKAVLIVNGEIPEKLIYLPDDEVEFDINKEIGSSLRAYLGMASCYEFVVERELTK